MRCICALLYTNFVVFHMYENASLFLKVVFLLNENVGIGSIITLASSLSINKATGAPRPPIITLASAPRELSNGSGIVLIGALVLK